MESNVLIISFKYPPEYSGYGNQLKSVLDKLILNDDRLTYTIITMFPSSLAMEDEKRKIISLNTKKNHNSGKLMYIFAVKLFFWMIKNRKKYKIIHCIKAGPEAIVANIISKLFNKRLIIKVAQDELSQREIGDSKGLVRLNRKFRHRILSNADNFIAISKAINEDLNKIVSNKTNIKNIPNGVDIDKYFPIDRTNQIKLRIQLGIPTNNEMVILFAGAINKRKGIPDLLSAIENLSSNIKCTFIFCGPILEDIGFTKKIEELNGKSNIEVIYAGSIENVHEYMKASNIFVLPSYSEGLPNVLLEAAASGLALISTDIGGSRDIVSHGQNGFLIPTNDYKAISQNIERLVNDKNMCKNFGTNSRIIALDHFSIDKVSNQYRELYFNLIKEN